MYKVVADIINSYSKQNKIISRLDFLKITKLLIKEKELENYVPSIKLDSDINPLGRYGFKYSQISINYDKIKKLIIDDNNYFIKNFTEYEKTLYHNLYLIGVFVHELEHAYQKKLMYKNDNTPESIITNITNRALSISIFDKNYQIFDYQKNLDKTKLINIKPIERTANLAKNLFILNILEFIQTSDNFKTFIKYNYYKTNFTYYGTIKSPSLTYLQKLENLEDKFDKNYYKENIEKLKTMNIDLEIKLKLGLSLDEEEKKLLIKKMFL